jgi:hypothetical protein
VLTEPSLDERIGDDVDHIGMVPVRKAVWFVFHVPLNAAAAAVLGQQSSPRSAPANAGKIDPRPVNRPPRTLECQCLMILNIRIAVIPATVEGQPMSREWNPKSFFRHLSEGAIKSLARWAGVRLAPSSTGKPWQRAYAAWKGLPEVRRMELESALLPVNDMCVPAARSYLEDVARTSLGRELEASRGWSVQDLALRLFIDAPAAFTLAHQSYSLDSLDHLREYQGKYGVTLRPTKHTKELLRDEMVSYLRSTAYGTNCQVEDFSNDEKFAVFVFHEDEVTPRDRFAHDGSIEPSWERDVVKLAAVFNLETCTLLVKAAKKTEREKLRDLFASVVIGEKSYFEDERTRPRFCFDRLRDPEFTFPAIGGSRLGSVSVTRLVVIPANPEVRRLSIDLKPSRGLAQLHESLETHGVNVGSDRFTGVQLRFCFQGTTRSRTRTVSLFNPNSSNLTDTPRDRLIRRHLVHWGIDASSRRAAVEASALQAAAH